MSLKTSLRPLIPDWLLDVYHWKLSALAAIRYGFPTRGIKVIGITGTNGKTTTAHFTESVLRAAGYRVGLLTTVSFGVNGHIRPNETKMTTVDPFLLNRRLAEIRAAGCTHIVMEVTSHAIAQHRTFGIRFDTTLFTNLTHDHLDYHKTMEAYRDTKLKLFATKPRVAIANLDDAEGERFLSLPAERHYGFTLTGKQAPKTTVISAKITKVGAEGSHVQVQTAASESNFVVPLPGRFNVQNALGALAIGFGADLPIQTMIKGIEATTSVPGRMESIDKGQPFRVIVDYAHTPDALKQVFEAVKPTVKGRLIHVGGATGDRDRTKRPILGALAGKFADIAIVTDEDPGTENPLDIITAVADGVRRGQRPKRIEGKNFFVVPNRRDAIVQAIDMAKADDVVLITGKGHETVMAVAGAHVPFSDRQIVNELLEHR